MSDLYWERISAGHYETTYFVNGYKYMITGEGIEWEAYYMFRTLDISKRRWRRLRYGTTDRLKSAKNLCWSHNQNPRTKYKISGRQPAGTFSKTGQERICFQEHVKNRNGEWVETDRYGRRCYDAIDFYASYSAPITYLGDEYLFGREAAITGENRYRLSDGSLVTPKFVGDEGIMMKVENAS